MANNEEKQMVNRRDKLTEEYKKAEAAYQSSIQEMQNIFQEELTRRETEGPFKTEQELDNFNNYYMNLKQKQNNIYLQSKQNLDNLKKELKILDKKTTRKKNNPQSIAFNPQNIKLLPEKRVSSIEGDKEERLIVANDIKAMIPVEPNQKKNKELLTVESSPVAKKVDTQKEKTEEKPIWERKIDFPEVKEYKEEIKIPYFPPFPYDEINAILSNDQPLKNKEETQISQTSAKKKTRMELVEEIFYYDESLDKKPKAKHVETTKEFKEEVKSNNTLYNIIKKVPGYVKTPFRLLKKLSDRILHSQSGAKKVEEVKEKISAHSASEIAEINEVLEKNKNSFPTAAKVMIAESSSKQKDVSEKNTTSVKLPVKNEVLEEVVLDSAENKTANQEKLNVEVPKVTLDSLQDTIDNEFRRMGVSEEEIEQIHEKARIEARDRLRKPSTNKEEITTEELLKKIDNLLNSSSNKNTTTVAKK